MTLRKLLERERDRAAKALKIKGELQFRMGVDHALDLLMPVVESIKTSIVVDHSCEECGTFTSVCYEIGELKKAIEELKAKLGDK